jgi:protocatechuate 3,4-dioxygenase beta subunit
MTPLQFTLVTEIVPITLTTVDGKTVNYELREMSSASREKYLDTLGDRVRYGPEGKPCGIKKFEGMQADLLTLCVFDSEGKAVTKAEVQKWPASVAGGIYESAQELNHLNEEKKDEPAKNG